MAREDTKNTTYIYVTSDPFEAETEKAVLIVTANGKDWFPKSKLDIGKPDGQERTVEIPGWLLEAKGLEAEDVNMTLVDSYRTPGFQR